MCRTDDLLDQVGTIEDVLEFDCTWYGLILEIQVYIAHNDNWGHVICQTFDKFGKVVKEDRWPALFLVCTR